MMKKKLIYSISFIATIVFGTTFLLFLPNDTSAAKNVTNVTNSKQTASYKTASIKSFKLIRAKKTIKIYQKPSTKSPILDSIENDQGLVVLKKYNNGWSKISLQFSTGYIQSKFLISPKKNTKTKYALNINRIYSYYSPENIGSGFNSYYNARFKTNYFANKTLLNFWYLNSEPDAFGIMEFETSKGLYNGYKDIGIATIAIKYPIRLNNTWKGLDGQIMKIVATNKIVKTQAGIYKNVVVVKEGKEKNYSYYAPEIGLIKKVYNGKTFSVLSAIH